MLVASHMLALIGSIFVVASLIGLGRIVQRTFHEKGTIPETIALGFVVNLIIGGLLDLLGAISLGTVIAVEIVGLSAFFLNRRELIYEIKKYLQHSYATLVLAVFYLLSVTKAAFSWHDDFNGYLIPVEKIIQTHHLGSDPFLVQRLLGLGSYFYAQAFYVFEFGYEHLSLLDPGLGRIIIGLLLIERLAKYFPAYPGPSLALLTSGLLAIWTWNTVAPLGIVTALLALLTFEVIEQKTKPVSFGLLAAGAICLKISIAPYVALLGSIWLVSIAQEYDLRCAARIAVITALSGATTLLPWMVSLRSSSGTFMYPILGEGYHALGPVYRFFSWDALWHTIRTQTHFVFGNILIMLGAVVLAVKSKQRSRWLVVSIAASMFLSMSLIIYATAAGGESFRYTLPVCASFGIVALTRIIDDDVLKSYRAKIIFGFLALATAAFVIPPRAFLTINKDNLLAIISVQAENNLEALFSRRYSLLQAQQLMPEHERILALTDAGMMFDFVRNPIWATGDYPGESSPPPGLANLQAPSEIRSYLLGLGISYVLVELNTERLADLKNKLASPTEAYLKDPWDYYQSVAAMRSYDAIARLAEESKVQWSNNYEVISLTSP